MNGLLLIRVDLFCSLQLIVLICLLLLIFIVDYCSIYFLLIAFGWNLPMITPIVTWVFVSFGMSLPSAPAGIGIHQLSCILALGFFAVPKSSAFAFSVILQVGAFTAIAVTLAVLYLLTFRKIKRPSQCDTINKFGA